jgi:hypothetical protein
MAGKYYQMTPKVDQTYQNILEDLANQGKGMLASRTGQNSMPSTTSVQSTQKPLTTPPPASNVPKPATPQASVTHQKPIASQNGQDPMKLLGSALQKNNSDEIAQHVSQITANDPDFFSKPEAKDINQWAQDPNNMKKLQQSQMKLMKGQQQNQANLQQMFAPQQ